MNEEFLHRKLEERRSLNSLRQLRLNGEMIDLCSNDYLGIVRNNLLVDSRHNAQGLKTGSTGSRLLSGNYHLIEKAEEFIAGFHEAESALIFNSGYDANLGLLSAIPQRGDTILYDHLSHSSIRDGTRLSFAESHSFRHNDLPDLEKKLQLAKGNIFVVTESVFSMDGDVAPLQEIVNCCKKFNAHLIVDEAHATGIFGNKGEGMIQALGLVQHCFARIHTFGKALGAHGAAIAGSKTLRDYLVNFSRPFIYTTSLPETVVNAIQESYFLLAFLGKERDNITKLINHFHDIFSQGRFAAGNSNSNIKISKNITPIQTIVIPGNDEVKKIADELKENFLDVRPILYPTVPKGQERLRIILHAFNTEKELEMLASLLG